MALKPLRLEGQLGMTLSVTPVQRLRVELNTTIA